MFLPTIGCGVIATANAICGRFVITRIRTADAGKVVGSVIGNYGYCTY